MEREEDEGDDFVAPPPERKGPLDDVPKDAVLQLERQAHAVAIALYVAFKATVRKGLEARADSCARIQASAKGVFQYR